MTKMQQKHATGTGVTDFSYVVGIFSNEEYAKTAGKVEEGRRRSSEYNHDYRYVVTKVKLDELHVVWDIETEKFLFFEIFFTKVVLPAPDGEDKMYIPLFLKLVIKM